MRAAPIADTPRALVRVRVRLPVAFPAAVWDALRRRPGRVLAAALVILAVPGTGYRYRPYAATAPAPAHGDATSEASPAELRRLRGENRRLEARLARRAPAGTHIVIDQTHNRLELRRGDEVLLHAVCSAGSGMVLREGEQGRVWVFDTPRGAFRVRSRVENPVWRKPDWAFIEAGQPIPADPAERIEYGTLGEYALHLGDGYMIHGTLYERLLGRGVTHGCIRVGRDDLRALWRSSRVGTPVYIF